MILMILATMVFAIQDGISRHLAESDNVLTIVRFFLWCRLPSIMEMVVNLLEPGNLFFRWGAAFYYLPRFVAVWAFILDDLVEYQATLTSHPLTINVLSALFLGAQAG